MVFFIKIGDAILFSIFYNSYNLCTTGFEPKVNSIKSQGSIKPPPSKSVVPQYIWTTSVPLSNYITVCNDRWNKKIFLEIKHALLVLLVITTGEPLSAWRQSLQWYIRATRPRADITDLRVIVSRGCPRAHFFITAPAADVLVNWAVLSVCSSAQRQNIRYVKIK